MNYQIAIDGVCGVGKSVVASQLADAIDFVYINTGIFFRGIALYSKLTNIDDPEALIEDIKANKFLIFIKNKVIIQRQDHTHLIITEEISSLASKLASHQAVRSYVLSLEKQAALYDNVVMEGRDIGSLVLPSAFLKIYLNASAKVRAERRYQQLLKLNKLEGLSLDDIEQSIKDRDHQDMNRKISPLKLADDAVEINTDGLSVEDVVTQIVQLYKKKLREEKLAKNPTSTPSKTTSKTTPPKKATKPTSKQPAKKSTKPAAKKTKKATPAKKK